MEEPFSEVCRRLAALKERLLSPSIQVLLSRHPPESIRLLLDLVEEYDRALGCFELVTKTCEGDQCEDLRVALDGLQARLAYLDRSLHVHPQTWKAWVKSNLVDAASAISRGLRIMSNVILSRPVASVSMGILVATLVFWLPSYYKENNTFQEIHKGLQDSAFVGRRHIESQFITIFYNLIAKPLCELVKDGWATSATICGTFVLLSIALLRSLCLVAPGVPTSTPDVVRKMNYFTTRNSRITEAHVDFLRNAHMEKSSDVVSIAKKILLGTVGPPLAILVLNISFALFSLFAVTADKVCKLTDLVVEISTCFLDGVSNFGSGWGNQETIKIKSLMARFNVYENDAQIREQELEKLSKKLQSWQDMIRSWFPGENQDKKNTFEQQYFDFTDLLKNSLMLNGCMGYLLYALPIVATAIATRNGDSAQALEMLKTGLVSATTSVDPCPPSSQALYDQARNISAIQLKYEEMIGAEAQTTSHLQHFPGLRSVVRSRPSSESRPTDLTEPLGISPSQSLPRESSSEQYKGMKVAELRTKLKSLGLSSRGTKIQLIDRLTRNASERRVGV